jgi:hypothetical protein
MVAELRGIGNSDLTVRIVSAIAAGRRDANRVVIGHAKDLDLAVDLGHIVEAARAQLEFEEALAIGAQRHFVIDARRHIAEMSRRHVVAADRLEVEDVDCLLWALDKVVRIERRPDQRIRRLRGRRGAFTGKGRKPAAGEQWTAGQKLQKGAPAGGAIES